jgi:ketosteroid isomerase-like protein
MKIRLPLALVGSAISFALATSAQQKDPVDPKIIEQLQEEDKNFEEAYNKHDAAAIAALFTDDAVLVTPRTERLPVEWRSRKNTRKKISRHTMAATWSVRPNE